MPQNDLQSCDWSTVGSGGGCSDSCKSFWQASPCQPSSLHWCRCSQHGTAAAPLPVKLPPSRPALLLPNARCRPPLPCLQGVPSDCTQLISSFVPANIQSQIGGDPT